MAVEIRPVETKGQWDAFIDLPWKIYRGNENWVPPLRIAVRDLLDVNKNPFFRHAFMRPMLAYKNGELVGRIVGVIDESHNRFHEEKTVSFGFFESVNDPEVSSKLLDEVLAWGRTRGMAQLRGPFNPSTNYECGLLVEGFNSPPAIMMTYNPPYYAQLFEQWGLKKVKDLFAYDIQSSSEFSERLRARSEKLKQQEGIKFRPMNMKKYDEEVDMVLSIYNDAWEKNWGFIPVDPVEFRHIAKDMKLVLDPNLALIAEVRGEPAGFSLALPDVNQAQKKIADGKLLPFGLFKLLWHLKGPFKRKTVDRCRVLTLGFKRKFQTLGLGPLFYMEYLRIARTHGYKGGEASWILEDNIPMNRALEHMCGQRTKVYRIYEKTVS